MSIDQTEVIDFIEEDESGRIILTVSDHLEWDETGEHSLLLQDKLNSYLRFIESGEIHDSYPNSLGKPVSINIVFKYQPTESGREFLSTVDNIIVGAAIGFKWSVLDA